MAPHYARMHRGVAPLWAEDERGRRMLGVCTLLAPEEGPVIAVALTDVLRRAQGCALSVGTDLGGGALAVTQQRLSRYVSLSVLTFAPWRWPTDDVTPIAIARLGGFYCAPDATHEVVALEAAGPSVRRSSIAQRVRSQRYAGRGGAGDDVDMLLVSHDATPPAETWVLEGAPVIAHLPASRRLATVAEDRLLGIAMPKPLPEWFASEGVLPWGELVPISLE